MAQIGIVKNLIATHGKNVHEHNFKIEFIFVGNLDGDFVGGIDFHEVIPKIDEVLSGLQNKYLPSVEGVGRGSCENLAVYIFKKLDIKYLTSVTVWEDADRFVKINKEDILI